MLVSVASLIMMSNFSNLTYIGSLYLTKNTLISSLRISGLRGYSDGCSCRGCGSPFLHNQVDVSQRYKLYLSLTGQQCHYMMNTCHITAGSHNIH